MIARCGYKALFLISQVSIWLQDVHTQDSDYQDSFLDWKMWTRDSFHDDKTWTQDSFFILRCGLKIFFLDDQMWTQYFLIVRCGHTRLFLLRDVNSQDSNLYWKMLTHKTPFLIARLRTHKIFLDCKMWRHKTFHDCMMWAHKNLFLIARCGPWWQDMDRILLSWLQDVDTQDSFLDTLDSVFSARCRHVIFFSWLLDVNIQVLFSWLQDVDT